MNSFCIIIIFAPLNTIQLDFIEYFNVILSTIHENFIFLVFKKIRSLAFLDTLNSLYVYTVFAFLQLKHTSTLYA